MQVSCVLCHAAGGQYQARIRSLCQFFNSTDMLLEVALLEEDDTGWTMLPYSATGTSPRSSPAAVGDVVEEEVFEYERYLPLRGWSPDHLKGLDPHRYCRQRSSGKGSTTFPKVQLPQVGTHAEAAGPLAPAAAWPIAVVFKAVLWCRHERCLCCVYQIHWQIDMTYLYWRGVAVQQSLQSCIFTCVCVSGRQPANPCLACV